MLITQIDPVFAKASEPDILKPCLEITKEYWASGQYNKKRKTKWVKRCFRKYFTSIQIRANKSS